MGFQQYVLWRRMKTGRWWCCFCLVLKQIIWKVWWLLTSYILRFEDHQVKSTCTFAFLSDDSESFSLRGHELLLGIKRARPRFPRLQELALVGLLVGPAPTSYKELDPKIWMISSQIIIFHQPSHWYVCDAKLLGQQVCPGELKDVQ